MTVSLTIDEQIDRVWWYGAFMHLVLYDLPENPELGAFLHLISRMTP
jgi:hypothetical protein